MCLLSVPWINLISIIGTSCVILFWEIHCNCWREILLFCNKCFQYSNNSFLFVVEDCRQEKSWRTRAHRVHSNASSDKNQIWLEIKCLSVKRFALRWKFIGLNRFISIRLWFDQPKNNKRTLIFFKNWKYIFPNQNYIFQIANKRTQGAFSDEN